MHSSPARNHSATAEGALYDLHESSDEGSPKKPKNIVRAALRKARQSTGGPKVKKPSQIEARLLDSPFAYPVVNK